MTWGSVDLICFGLLVLVILFIGFMNICDNRKDDDK